MQKENSNTADRELVITRLLNAPCELVWEAWTNPEHIKNWWGPNGFTNSISEMNVAPGGIWNLIMHGPDGTDYKNKSQFREIVKYKEIVFDHISGPKYTATVRFEKQGNKTLLTWHMLFETKEQFEQVVKVFKADEGLKQNVEKLEAFLYTLSDDNVFIITKELAAPRDLVFKVWTEAEHLIHWWGPKGFDIEVKKLDFQSGGIFHYCMKAASGQTMWGRFKYREIVSPEKIVFTSSFSDEDGNITRAPFGIEFPLEVLNIFTFTEQDGKTIMTLKGGPVNATEEEIAVYKSLHASMQQGFGGTFEKLSDYLSGLLVS